MIVFDSVRELDGLMEVEREKERCVQEVSLGYVAIRSTSTDRRGEELRKDSRLLKRESKGMKRE